MTCSQKKNYTLPVEHIGHCITSTQRGGSCAKFISTLGQLTAYPQRKGRQQKTVKLTHYLRSRYHKYTTIMLVLTTLNSLISTRWFPSISNILNAISKPLLGSVKRNRQHMRNNMKLTGDVQGYKKWALELHLLSYRGRICKENS